MKAPPERKAALEIAIARPRLRTNHLFMEAVVACMKVVDAPREITNRYTSMKAR